MSGFVLVHRALIGNPQFRGKDDEYAALWLIVKAAWERTRVRVAGKAIELERGQCCYAIAYLAESWGCAKSTAHARLDFFARCGFIRTEVRTGLTVVTLCNYDEYQLTGDGGRTDDRTPAERSPNDDRTNKNEGNEKKERREDLSVEPRRSGGAERRAEPTDRDCRADDGQAGTAPASAPPGHDLPPGERASGKHPGHDPAIDADFEIWWGQVPRKVAKGAALQAYRAARKSVDAGVLTTAIMRYSAECVGREPQFIKHPATWLRGQCWLDDPTPPTGEPHAQPPGRGGRHDAPSHLSLSAAGVAVADRYRSE